MTDENQSSKSQTDPRVMNTLRRMQTLREENRSRNNEIVHKTGSELISNSPLSFAFSFTTLVLSGAGVLAASPVVAAGAAFGLIASVSLLGIKFAGLMAPVRQSEYDQIKQITSGMLGLTFSTVGQITGGNKGFETLGNVGSSLDSLIEMRSSLNGIYGSTELESAVQEMYKYGDSMDSFMDSTAIVLRNTPLTVAHSTNRPMTTINIETDPINEQVQRDRALKEEIDEIRKADKAEEDKRAKEKAEEDKKAEKDEKTREAEKAEEERKAKEAEEAAIAKSQAESQAYWAQYFQAREQVHDFEQHPPTTQSPQYPLPQPSSIYNKDPGTTRPSIPSYEPNPYHSSDSGVTYGSGGSLLNYGGSSTSDTGFESSPSEPVESGTDGTGSGGLGEGPLG